MEVTGESAESGAYRGLGVRPSSGRDFGGYRGFGRTCRVKVFRLSLEVAGVSSAFTVYKGFRPKLEDNRVAAEWGGKIVWAEI